MDQNTIAIVTSVAAISVSSLTLGWTIYRDAIQKPKFRVFIAIKKVIQGPAISDPFIIIEFLNIGPLRNRCSTIVSKPAWWDIKNRKIGGFTMPDHTHSLNTQGGSWIEIGDEGRYILPIDSEFITDKITHRIGICDGYGRVHWAPRKQLREVQLKVRSQNKSK